MDISYEDQRKKGGECTIKCMFYDFFKQHPGRRIFAKLLLFLFLERRGSGSWFVFIDKIHLKVVLSWYGVNPPSVRSRNYYTSNSIRKLSLCHVSMKFIIESRLMSSYLT
jgi:hypothetical protein